MIRLNIDRTARVNIDTNLEDLLIVLGLRLGHLGSDRDIVLKAAAHVLPSTQALDQEVGSLVTSISSAPVTSTAGFRGSIGCNSTRTPCTHLTAISVGNSLILADGCPSSNTAAHGS